MATFLGLIAFAFAFYLFLITNNKIKSLKSNLLVEETKKEIEALITEFNRAAARNIEILEDRISTIQELLKKADIKILKLEEISRTNSRPLIIEKIVEKKTKETDFIKEDIREEKQKVENAVDEKPLMEETADKEHNQRIKELKSLLKSGKTKEELLSMGFMENEINLVSFLVKTRKD